MKEQEKKVVDATEKDLKEVKPEPEKEKEKKPGFLKKIGSGAKKVAKKAAPVAKKTLNVVAKIGGIGAAVYVAYKGISSNSSKANYYDIQIPTVDLNSTSPAELTNIPEAEPAAEAPAESVPEME